MSISNQRNSWNVSYMLTQEALQFFSRLALLCERNCLALQDFTGELGDVAALDLGCAVGGASFQLARAFPRVVGVDSSAHFVKAAQVIVHHCYQFCTATLRHAFLVLSQPFTAITSTSAGVSRTACAISVC